MSQLKRRDKKPSHTPGLARARPLGGGGVRSRRLQEAPAAPPWLSPQYRLQYPFWFSLPTATTCKVYLS